MFAILSITFTFVYGQKSIDALFEKYAGRDGFTTVSINGDLLEFAKCFDIDDDADDNSLSANITDIRILTQEDKELHVENFYDVVIKDIDLNKYEEFMRVKESDQDMRILVRREGKKFREFLLISGGESNTLIQIKGNLSFDEAKKLSEDARKNHHPDIVADQK
jgi:hypothetical protein